MPIIDYVAADHDDLGDGGQGPPACVGDVRNSGTNYLQTRFKQNMPRKGSPFATTPDANDGAVYQDEAVDYVKRNWGELVRRNRGEPLSWRDPLWMFLAYADPKRARELFDRDPYFTPEFGSSTALTYHVLTNLAALGRLNTGVTANSPTSATFERGGRPTHVAYNASEQARAVKFSDGVTLQVPARSLAHDAPRP